jgi:hypothetical protein
MSVIVLVWEIEGHFYFKQFLLLRWLVPEGLLVEGEANDDSLDSRALLVQFLVFLQLFWRLSLQFDVPEQAVLRNYHV